MSLDDQTIRYVIAIRPHFEDLRQVAAQLAGLLVLAASGASMATPEHPMLVAAQRTYDAANDGIRRIQPSPGARAHHRHLLKAAEVLGRALREMRGTAARTAASQVDRVMPALRAGYGSLQRAARALPGFELVDFDRGCCSVHARPLPEPGARSLVRQHGAEGR
jgi:hypothetical protein